ncbi:MAG: glycosyltransferase family 2 protein [Clostridiales bacterium]|nr:glycosyltransferase family 2 protein [Clostridiales bacterium]
MKVSIIIPCHNEEECINKYYDAMRPVRQKLDVDFEYIFVDDGSTDKTLDLVKALALKDSEVRYVSFSRNFGKEAAIYAGLKNSTGDYVGLMDADLQDPPEMLLEMYEGLQSGEYDCVGCRRTTRKGESKIRSAFARMFYRLINKMSDVEIVDGARDYRLMTRTMTNAVLELSERERFSKGIFSWVGFKTKWLEYKNTERVAGKTKWSFSGLTKYAVNGIEDFSTAPLKFNLILAISLFVSSLAFTVFDIVWWCLGNAMYEWFIITPIMLFVAALLAVGLVVIGEYVKKIFREVKARPIYLVRETDADLDRNADIKITCDDYTVSDTKETDKIDA